MNTMQLIKLKNVVDNEAYLIVKNLSTMDIGKTKDAIHDERENTKFNR